MVIAGGVVRGSDGGIVGEAVLAKPLAIWLQTFGLEAAMTDVVSTAIVVVGVTYVAIVIGELVPKRLGQLNPEVIARLVARPMQILAIAIVKFLPHSYHFTRSCGHDSGTYRHIKVNGIKTNAVIRRAIMPCRNDNLERLANFIG